MTTNINDKKEREAKVLQGIGWVLLPIISVILLVVGGILFTTTAPVYINAILIVVGALSFIFSMIGSKIISPNTALVFTLFGKYVGTTKFTGYIIHNPFYINYRVSTKFTNLPSEIIKVNDKIGNPIEVAAVAVWSVDETYKAVFDVENYFKFISVQFESAVRQMITKYPYDFNEDNTKDALTLRQNTDDVNLVLTKELQERVSIAGIYIKEARLTHLAYAPEIASVMLKRQQAAAIIDAKSKIVQGSVDMVKMAIERLDDDKDIKLTSLDKARMAQDLMLILCSDKEATPVIDIGRKSNK